MKIIRSIDEMRFIAAEIRRTGRTIGLVPTMGALHNGHRSLLSRVHNLADVRIVSLFVNPAQFGPNEDYAKYPRMFEADCAMARDEKCDYVFAPDAAGMYPPPYHTYVQVDTLSKKLCGGTRPIHFKGVTTVVLKFFNIILPQVAVFGQKDAQQVIILKRMVADLNCGVIIDVAPTVRESDGLAMSSRNQYLTIPERDAAAAIHRGLCTAKNLFIKGQRAGAVLKSAVEKQITTTVLNIEYIELVDCVSLDALPAVTTRGLLAVACRTTESNTRLIDNIIIGGSL